MILLCFDETMITENIRGLFIQGSQGFIKMMDKLNTYKIINKVTNILEGLFITVFKM